MSAKQGLQGRQAQRPRDIVDMRDDDVQRMPAPWRVDMIPGGYVVKDANGRSLAYCYAGTKEARSANHNLLSPEEARRMAVNIAKLPELLGRKASG